MTAFRLFRSAPRSDDTDADLLARFVAARDESAFAELLRRHGPLVYRVCRRLLDASLAEDAFQAAFLVLATRATTVRKATSVGSWLIGVAGRVARQMRRRMAIRAPLHVAANPVAEPPEIADLGRVLDEELTRLPDKLRAVVVACLIEERTQADAATALGESERTVRRRVLEARQLLRERLERRGVVPAVAGGLIAGLGGTAAAVPVRLGDSTLTVVFDFLAGGASVASVPASIAKGVAMSGFRAKVMAAVAVVALGLSALGVGLADDRPKSEATIPPTKVPLGDKQPTEPPRPALTGPPLFVVTGADELANRVVQREAEYAARKVAERWGVRPLPPLKEKWKISIKLEPGRNAGATTFTFGSEPKRGVQSAEMQLTGSLEQILRNHLPHEVTHCVLAAHFGRPLPRWVDEGVAVLSESAKEQADHDRKVREFTNAGRAIRLAKLLPMTEYPRDMIVLYAQGHSVARFLHERDAKKLLPLIEASFADGWDQGLKATYGFADADDLEEAWLAWLKQPDSVLKAEAKAVKSGRTDYTVEAPDILLIDGKWLTPLPPYKIEPLDGLSLKVTGTPEAAPIKGNFPVDADGTINLGPDYGGPIKVTGLTAEQAEQKLAAHLKKILKEPTVRVSVAEARGVQQIQGEHLVRPDGTVGLGVYGNVAVAGLTLPQVKAAVEKHLSKWLSRPEVSVDVAAFNSKVYYVITDGRGSGEQVQRLPLTGNETVLSAVAAIGGLPDLSLKWSIWVARPGANGGKEQILPVDWKGITELGESKTDYQLLPGDRVYVKLK